MATHAPNSFNVEPLNGGNYHTWKFRMTILLTERDVIEFVKQKYDDSNYEDAARKAEAKKKDSRCKSLIVQCLNNDQIEIIRDKDTAYSMWRSLEERYEKKGIPGQLMLKRKLLSMKLKEADDLEVFLTEFDEIIRQLKATGAEFKDQDIVCNLLLAMPRSFETVITILENMPEKELTLEVAKSKLRAELERRKALVVNNAKVETKSAAFWFSRGSRDVCYSCGEKGHYKRDCKKNSGQTRRGQGEYDWNRRGGSGFSKGRGCRRGHRIVDTDEVKEMKHTEEEIKKTKARLVL